MMASEPASSPATDFAAPQQRRRWLLGAAAVATLSGAGVAWWRTQKEAVSRGAEPVAGFWSAQWESPSGEQVHMRDFQGRPLLVNFWATWCPPCIDELPLINAFYQENKSKGLKVLGLAVDKPAAVQAFLKKMPLDFPVAMAGATGADLARSLGNLAGGLPFSVLLGADGAVVLRKMGRLIPADLQAWARVK